MREIDAASIAEVVARLCQEANFDLPEDVAAAVEKALSSEESPTGKEVLRQILENARIAREERVPMCQDTGFAVFFLELGQDVHVVGGDLYEAVNEGVRRGYTEGFLRKSILADPLKGGNTGDNTPAVIHTSIVPGDRLKIIMAAKGGGSENMSAVGMLKPADGIEGVRRFVIETVKKAGPNPCPPVVVGVGIGGTFEKVALLAKRALLRPIGQYHPDPDVAALEAELNREINKLGIGPAGMGGRTTAFWVSIETFPRHIASFPVAVNIQCHASRHKEAVL